MMETKHHWLPVILAIYLPVSFFTTYGIAVARKHVAPAFPYISDTGTVPPESCVFALLLSLGAVLGGIVMYIKYRQLLQYVGYGMIADNGHLYRLNNAAFIVGLLAMFGVCLVGSFQETNVIVVHFIGAFLAFVIGFVYCVLQTVITFLVSRNPDIPGISRRLAWIRVAICIVEFVLLVTMLTLAPISKQMGPGIGKSKLHWSSDDAGYDEHIGATISEWLVSFTTVIFIGTFYAEFKHFRVVPPKLEYYDPAFARACQEIDAESTSLMGEQAKGYSTIGEAE